MNERFLIPSAVAVTLHALLFFGFGRGRPPVIELEPPAVVVPPPPINAVLVDLSSAHNDEEAVPAPKGNPDEARRELPELPLRESVIDLPIPREPPRPTPVETGNKIVPGQYGRPDGIEGSWGAETAVFRSDLLDNLPRTRTQLAPVYPSRARQEGRRGEVLVEFVVDEDGQVLDPRVVRSNDPIFDAPTLRAVAKWRFEPGRRHGHIVRFRMAVPVAYAVNP